MNSIGIFCRHGLRNENGIGRAIATVCTGSENPPTIFTETYNSGIEFSYNNAKIIEGEIPYPTKSLYYNPLKMKEYLSSVKTFADVLEHHGIRYANAHSVPDALALSFAKLINPDISVSLVLYSREGITWRHQMLLSFLFFHIGLIDKLIVLDNNMRHIVSKFFRIPQEDVHLWRIGVSKELLDLSRRPPSDSHEKDLTSIHFHGLLIPRRRVEDLLSALSQASDSIGDWELIISGGHRNEEYAEYLRTTAEVLNIADHLEFRGKTTDKELATLYASSDVFVWPNNPQTWGLAPLEALCFGTPVIVSTGCGVSEVIENVAYLVPPESPDSLAKALIEVINSNTTIEKARNGEAFVKDNLSYKETAKQLENIVRNKETTPC